MRPGIIDDIYFAMTIIKPGKHCYIQRVKDQVTDSKIILTTYKHALALSYRSFVS